MTSSDALLCGCPRGIRPHSGVFSRGRENTADTDPPSPRLPPPPRLRWTGRRVKDTEDTGHGEHGGHGERGGHGFAWHAELS